MTYELPESLEICGADYAIRSGYRAVLDVCAALSDPELSGQEKSYCAMVIFYPDFESIPQEHLDEAMEKLVWFIDCGTKDQAKQRSPRLVDWEQDFPIIAAPVNRVLGTEIRRKDGPEDYGIHWWTFISAYQEIGDCTFAQVVRLRDRKARGKSLDKQDQEWYRRNRDLVDLKRKYTSTDDELCKGVGRQIAAATPILRKQHFSASWVVKATRTLTTS